MKARKERYLKPTRAWANGLSTFTDLINCYNVGDANDKENDNANSNIINILVTLAVLFITIN